MILALVIGFLAGAVVATLLFVATMRSRMLDVFPSPLGSVEETVAAIEKGIATVEGWNSPATRDLNGMMARNGVQFGPKVRLVEMCNARHAADVLRDDRRVATLLPCALAVYEDDRNKVWISRLNLALLGKVFGGKAGSVMGSRVAPAEKRILGALRS